ncbi:hypothetical protein ACIBI4_06165 [Streptomyces sp. NPDC050418]|uniref:hypothetical protein n=1 Tax=Streptomyces sp. NPDC050418 TaxID=3365612 RepID=UPI0037ABCBE4
MAGTAEEVVEITMTDVIRAVIPVAYSAQPNGTGSFRRYAVSLEVDNGQGSKVVIDAKNADANDRVYTCVPASSRTRRTVCLCTPLRSTRAPARSSARREDGRRLPQERQRPRPDGPGPPQQLQVTKEEDK